MPPSPLPETLTRRPKPRGVRAERLRETRRALLRATAEIVGEEGYAECSISKITHRAGVGAGTFYTYFGSRQEIFDALLPELGEEMLDFIRGSVRGSGSGIEAEERAFQAFLEFHRLRPGYYRILNEAETFAPEAFRAHTHNITAGYVRALRRSWEAGELPGYQAKELEALALILLSFRHYLGARYALGTAGGHMPEAAVRTYMKFVRGGLRAEAEAPAKRRGR